MLVFGRFFFQLETWACVFFVRNLKMYPSRTLKTHMVTRSLLYILSYSYISDLFGIVICDPFKGCWWPPTKGSKGHIESGSGELGLIIAKRGDFTFPFSLRKKIKPFLCTPPENEQFAPLNICPNPKREPETNNKTPKNWAFSKPTCLNFRMDLYHPPFQDRWRSPRHWYKFWFLMAPLSKWRDSPSILFTTA